MKCKIATTGLFSANTLKSREQSQFIERSLNWGHGTHTERFIYYHKYILQITPPSQYWCTQLKYKFAASCILGATHALMRINRSFQNIFLCCSRSNQIPSNVRTFFWVTIYCKYHDCGRLSGSKLTYTYGSAPYQNLPIWDGNSEIGAHVRSNLCYFIC